MKKLIFVLRFWTRSPVGSTSPNGSTAPSKKSPSSSEKYNLDKKT